MTITRSQVADLQPGDVVELRDERWAEGTVLRGPVVADPHGCLEMGGYVLLTDSGSVPYREHAVLTVVSRAPRPLYVNHPRTEPVPGDVVRDADDDSPKVWMRARDFHSDGIWLDDIRVMDRDKLPVRLRLLVDGETGQAVQ